MSSKLEQTVNVDGARKQLLHNLIGVVLKTKVKYGNPDIPRDVTFMEPALSSLPAGPNSKQGRRLQFRQCKYCYMEFKDKIYLDRHLSSHTSSKALPKNGFTCPMCRKVFLCEKSLRDHFLTHDGTHNPSTANACEECGGPRKMKDGKLLIHNCVAYRENSLFDSLNE